MLNPSSAPYTNVALEQLPADLTSKAIYRSGEHTEDVTLMHDGDALGDVLFGITAGKLSSNAGKLTRSVPVRFRLAPNSTITASATAMGADGTRSILVIATPMTMEASTEEELHKLRCLMEQLVMLMTTLVDRMPIK